MMRDLRLYLLAVALPAVLLAAGGIRLISLESGRARAMMHDHLNSRAAALSSEIGEALREKGLAQRRPRRMRHGKMRDRQRSGDAHDDSHMPPAGPGPHGGPRGRMEGETCRRHELPKDIAAVVESVIRESSDSLSEEVSFPLVAEIRHDCGCVLVSSGNRIEGSIFGVAPLGPAVPHCIVCVAPEGGDAVAVGSIRAQAFQTAIMLFLLFGALAAGVMLLTRAARIAREEARQKTDFISNVSHELKTPLTSISLFSEMLAGGTDLGEESRRKAAETMLAESKRLSKIIDDLLDITRLERQQRTYTRVDFDVGGLLREVADLFSPSFPNGLRIASAEGIAHADRDAARRIVSSLVENAAKYAAASGEVVLSSRAEGSKIEITVADRGPGLTPAETRHAFERFWRADNSLTRTTSGTGLGLAIAKELAVGTGGDLSVGPNEGGGSVFTLVLPKGG